MLKRFEKAIKTAKADNQDRLKFKGHDLLVTYADYLAEYLRSQFGLDKVSK